MGYVLTMLFRLVSALAVLGLFRSVYFRLAYARSMRRRGCQHPPHSPERYPVLGLDWSRSIAKAMRDGELYAVLRQKFQQCGRTYAAAAMGSHIIHTMDPRNIQSVLALDFARYGVEPTRAISAEPLLGKGVFTSDGEFWAFSRKLGKPLFARAQIADYAQFETHVDRLLSLIPRDGSTVDLQPLFKRVVWLRVDGKGVLGAVDC